MSCVCGVCSHLVKRNHRKLTCKLCKKYVHKCCSDLTAKEFRCSESTKYWHCASCNETLTLPFNHITNECEFQLQLCRCFENGLLNTDHIKSHFENMKFNPIDDSVHRSENNECNNNSQYYFTDELKDTASINKKNLTMLCSNVRSVKKNFDSLTDLLSEIDINFQVIGLVETWLKDKPHDYYHLKGYNLEICNRVKKKGGGVCMYVDEKMPYNMRNDLNELNNLKDTESLSIEIEKQKSKNIVIGVII